MLTSKLVTASGGPALPYIRKEMAKIRKEIKAVSIRMEVEVNMVGVRAGHLMADRVRGLTKRQGATGELATALETSMQFKRYGMHGVQVSLSSSSLPIYWAMINYGGYVSNVGLTGFWSDNKGKSNSSKAGGKGTGQFRPDKQGYPMMPASPIKGFHYLNYAYRKVLSEMRSGGFTRRIMKSTK